MAHLWAMRHFLPPALLLAVPLAAQVPLSGPMTGHTSLTGTTLWMQCHAPCQAAVQYWPEHAPDSVTVMPTKRSDPHLGHVLKFTVEGLRPGTTYRYQVSINGTTLAFPEALSFRTQPHWRFRSDPPEFTIALGSCAYINEPSHDRPGTPYGGEYGIFDAIAAKAPDVMLWLGDNIYLREPDQYTRGGYLHRYTHTRATPEMQALLRCAAHYAIWDDHDFGPNDADGSWPLAPKARELFELFWANPTTGVPGAENTVASAFSWGDVDVFLLDDRTHRTRPDLRTSPTALLGAAQLDWLVRALKYSSAPFKLVAIGSQVLNTEAIFETYATIPGERAELLRRIEEEGIRGVVFLTGDRHFTELSELELKDGRVLYDLTVSPLTSGVHPPREEDRNTNRVKGTVVTQRNFATLTFSGPRKARSMAMRVFDTAGTLLWERTIEQDKVE
jgi:alkaline phosphatase D